MVLRPVNVWHLKTRMYLLPRALERDVLEQVAVLELRVPIDLALEVLEAAEEAEDSVLPSLLASARPSILGDELYTPLYAYSRGPRRRS